MKTIIDVSNIEAKEFFLKEESYFSVELPEYFTFQYLLENLDKELLNKDLNKDLGTAIKVRDLDDVNYIILNNKDGKLSWRPFQLIHPAIYVNLVYKITEKNNWQTIVNRFKLFSENTNIECHSLPVTENADKSAKENQIYEWWQNVEQRSILMALEYKHVLHLDITDCYGALYTHSIVWALHEKEEAKKPENKNKEEFIGNVIDWRIQDMSNGQTNGIPQGSVLMDFIAEIVLGYGDLLLTERLNEKRITDYKIIRYRDDYRIFTKNEQISSLIAKELSEVLSSLNFKVNNGKTVSNNDLVLGAIKPDKIHWIYNKRKTENIQKWLLQIYILGEKFPNSGTLYKEVKLFLDWLKKREDSVIENDSEEKKVIYHSDVLISILINLAYNNPRLYPLVTGSISYLITKIIDVEYQKDIIHKIHAKFKQLPNTNYLDVWLQRLTLKIDVDIIYAGKLCEKVIDNSASVWNSDWLNPKIKKLIENVPIIDSEKINDLQISFSKAEINQLGEYDKLFS
jgi:RNA-directed DNA polymerase